MFKKLLSNLPFNPSLVGQLAFYTRRLRAESAFRRLGLILIVFTLFIQMFAVITPPETSLAASNNDIIFGGASSVAALKSAYNNNAGGDVQKIFAHYGVGTAELDQAQNSSVDTRGANVNRYYSIGRTIGSRSDSFQVSIPGTSTPIYMRTLGGWAQQTWPAFSVPSSKYGRVWILKDCGNIVTDGIPPTGTPALGITKTASPGPNSSVKPGDKIQYNLIFNNKGTAPAKNFKIEDIVPAQLQNIQVGESGAYEYVSGQTFQAYWDIRERPSILGNHPTLQYQVNFSATVRPDALPGKFCNRATATSTGSNATSNEVCHVIPACPYNPSVPPNHPSCKPPVTPVAACTLLTATYISRTKVEFEASATSADGATVQSFEFNSGVPGKTLSIPVNAPGNVTKKFSFEYPGSPAPASYNAVVTAVTSLGNKTSQACQRPIEIAKENTPLVTVEKAAIGPNGTKLSQTKVAPGQTLDFAFTVKNIGDAEAVDYVMPEDDITDVLEYADIVTPNDATVVPRPNNQGTVLQWKPFNLKAGQTVEKKVTFKVKDVLPKTNTPPGNTQSFDCRIQNSISSSTVIVDLDQSNCIVKVIEQTATALPNTGPGTSLLIGFSLVVFVGYFFARSRLMAKELSIVRVEYVNAGGV